MAAWYEAVASGTKVFDEKAIMELEITNEISSLWYVKELIEDEEFKNLVEEWRTDLLHIRQAIDPVLESSKMEPVEMIRKVRGIADTMRAISKCCKPHGKILSEMPNGLYGIASALRTMYNLK